MNINNTISQSANTVAIDYSESIGLAELESFGIGTPPVETSVELSNNSGSSSDDYSKSNTERMLEAAMDLDKDIYHVPGISRSYDNLKGTIVDLMV